MLILDQMVGSIKPYNKMVFEDLYIKIDSMHYISNISSDTTFINCIIHVTNRNLANIEIGKIKFFNCHVISMNSSLFTGNIYLSKTTFSLGCRYGYADQNSVFLDIKTNKKKGTTAERNTLSFDNYKGLNFYNIDIDRNNNR